MRVLLVADQLSAEGGAEAMVNGLARGLDERGHVVAVLVSRAASGAPALPARVALRVVPWAAEGETSNAAAADAALQMAADFRPDVVNLHSVFDLRVIDALLARWPVVWHCHDHRFHCPNGDRRYPRTGKPCLLPMGAACIVHSFLDGCVAGPRARTVAALVARRQLFAALGRADRIAVLSDFVAGLLLRNGISSERIAKVPASTPFADLADAPAVDHDSSGVLFAGRLVVQKGVDEALWLAERFGSSLAPAQVVFAGDGPLVNKVRDASRVSKNIRYLGKLGSEELSAAFRGARTVVMPIRWLEPFGLVGIEAMAHARPVVAYRMGGVGEWLQDGVTGMAVRPGDRDGLWRAVASLVSDVAMAAEMGGRGRELVRSKYRPRHGLAEVERVYNEALRSRGRQAAVGPVALEIFRASADQTRWQSALEVRVSVFVREQDVPMADEVDEHDLSDPSCVHVLGSTVPEGRPVGTARLYELSPTCGRVGRLAVLPAFRREGYGLRLLDELLAAARRRGYQEVVLDAQTQTLDFYARRGFVAEGSAFFDCGIEHRRMRLPLI